MGHSAFVRMCMTLAYDGSQFYGFAHNEGVVTVAGVLNDALSQVLRSEIDVVCAGRTDRGVHARAQVVSFDAPAQRVDPPRLMRAINRMCAPHIAVSQTCIAPANFNARHCCTGRVYRYRILNSATPDPLAASQSWYVPLGLDLQAMRAAADLLVGDHDFSSFCRKNPSKTDQSMVRTVRRAVWWSEGDFKVFEIEARSFCHQMVRSLVALLVSVGSGHRKPESVADAIAARDRSVIPSPAPPQGLVLWNALYETPLL